MKLITIGIGFVGVLATACVLSSTVSTVSTSAGDVVPDRAPAAGSLPAGVVLRGTLDHTLGPATNRVGDVVSVTLSGLPATANPKTATGAVAYGHVTGLTIATAAGGQASVQVTFDSLLVDGSQHVLDADLSKIDAANVSPRAVDPAKAQPDLAIAGTTLISFGRGATQVPAGTGVRLLVLSTLLLDPP